ncbi:hypothetical protein [Caballeronia sp. S22]|uniref:hypothetical protein n=1 Tax=Caballeronia sp. S22 TaxID=3137182 RepID=UPI0035310903
MIHSFVMLSITGFRVENVNQLANVFRTLEGSFSLRNAVQAACAERSFGSERFSMYGQSRRVTTIYLTFVTLSLVRSGHHRVMPSSSIRETLSNYGTRALLAWTSQEEAAYRENSIRGDT